MAEDEKKPETTAPQVTPTASEEQSNKPAGPQFVVQRIYLKDASFESPKSPGSFQANWTPKISFNIASKSSEIQSGVFDVVLVVTIEAKKYDEVAFLVEVHQAGIFTCVGFSQQELERVVSTVCPNILFPYARETIDNMVVKGSFPPIMLAPVNFDALYAQSKEQQASGGNGAAKPDINEVMQNAGAANAGNAGNAGKSADEEANSEPEKSDEDS